MGELVPPLVIVTAPAAVMGFFTWLAIVARRRGVAGSALSAALASYNEAYQGTAHQAYHEIRAQAERQVPVLSPDGAWRPVPPAGEGVRRRRETARRPLRGLRRRIRRLRHGR
ncbi:hypothetical protein OG978_22960 [Streptomyces sp. NBC_01591]|uniref:hypothetical protein n=1 Tax=Streptomyces sp. NBC_01591 TaxID=2975888 RepID=UPI002DD8A497|nr:hypothetical protein [Streptomyces sp. NBC_01591]WSD69984.1 hypothetical protein OG978_22960 [Streptomyces sp. NBC_01591]